MNKGSTIWILLLLVLAGFGTVSHALSENESGVIRIVNVNEPDTFYSLILAPGIAQEIVVRNSRLAGIYVEVMGASSGSLQYRVVVENSSLNFLGVVPRVEVVGDVNVSVVDSRFNRLAIYAGHAVVRRVQASFLEVDAITGRVDGAEANSTWVMAGYKLIVRDLVTSNLTALEMRSNNPEILLDNVALSCGTGRVHDVTVGGFGDLNVVVENSNLTCMGEPVIMNVTNIRSFRVLNSSLGSLLGFISLDLEGRSGATLVYVENSTLTGNMRIGATQIDIVNSGLGEYWPNGTVIRRIRGLRTSVSFLLFKNLTMYRSTLNAYIVQATGHNTQLESTWITATLLTLYTQDTLVVEGSRLLSQVIDVEFSFHRLRIEDSVISGDLYVDSINPRRRVNIAITRDRFTQTSNHATIYISAGRMPVDIEVNDSIIESPGFKMSIVSNPLHPARIRVSTSGSYWGSPLGPTVTSMNKVLRRGGAYLSVISPNASINLASWKATPLGPLVKPCKGSPEPAAGPGMYAFGMVNGECALILDAEGLVDRIWVYSASPLLVRVAGVEGRILVNTTVSGNTTIMLPESATILFIYYHGAASGSSNSPAINTATTTSTTPPVNQTSEPSGPTSETSSRRGSNGTPAIVAAGLVLAVALAAIGYYFYTINKRH